MVRLEFFHQHKLFIVCALLLLLVSACAPASILTQMRDSEKKPAIYKEGYVDGCQSGRNKKGEAVIFFKDNMRYESENDYALGWDEGFVKCSK